MALRYEHSNKRICAERLAEKHGCHQPYLFSALFADHLAFDGAGRLVPVNPVSGQRRFGPGGVLLNVSQLLTELRRHPEVDRLFNLRR